MALLVPRRVKYIAKTVGLVNRSSFLMYFNIDRNISNLERSVV
jgi:hypothetical protein